MRAHLRMLTGVLALMSLGAHQAGAQQVTKENVPGITNLARLETTVACAGATQVEAIPEIKKMGFASIINLRRASEEGAAIEAEAAAAKAAGLRFYHIPFNTQAPSTDAADQFLAAITTKGSEPAFIHCAGGNRAATMWLIKRIAVDHWETDKAVKEAVALGQTNEALRTFAIEYGQAHKR